MPSAIFTAISGRNYIKHSFNQLEGYSDTIAVISDKNEGIKRTLDEEQCLRKSVTRCLSKFINSEIKKDNYSDIVVLNIGYPGTADDIFGPLIGTYMFKKIAKQQSDGVDIGLKLNAVTGAPEF